VPATYQHDHFSFQYPENWLLSVSDSTADNVGLHLSLESPSGSMWMLSAIPPSADAEQMMAEAKQAIDDQYEEVDWSSSEPVFFGHDSQGLDGFFYSLDLLIAVRIRCFKTLDHLFVIVIEGESRDFDANASVYDAICLSLLRSTISA
jgi:hypothetical protein